MKYNKVYLDSIGYELPPVVVTSQELEEKLTPLYKKLHFPMGQLEELTGIYERRWWEEQYPISKKTIKAAKKALSASSVSTKDIDVFIYAGVCREWLEPATACGIAAALEISPDAHIYDISNACLGVINGILNIANHIELGHIRAGMVVSCESTREINEIAIKRLNENPTIKNFKYSMATLTGGSGAIAVLVTDDSFQPPKKHRLLGGVACGDPEYYQICRWEMQPKGDGNFVEVIRTDAISVLNYGIELGKRTWKNFLEVLDWDEEMVDKTICHQVAAPNRDLILNTLHIDETKDFFTYPYLGNIGTVSLPITAAIAEEREFLQAGDNVGFLGIGSGLNCMMLGLKW